MANERANERAMSVTWIKSVDCCVRFTQAAMKFAIGKLVVLELQAAFLFVCIVSSSLFFCPDAYYSMILGILLLNHLTILGSFDQFALKFWPRIAQWEQCAAQQHLITGSQIFFQFEILASWQNFLEPRSGASDHTDMIHVSPPCPQMFAPSWQQLIW